MLTKTQAIKNFLSLSTSPLASLYNPDMEVQVNVKRGKRLNKSRGTPTYVEPSTGDTWKSFRIPFNAGIDATYSDSDMNFDLSDRAEGIGMTGWNWKDKKSVYVGFDIDSIINHKVGLSDEELSLLVEECKKVPYINVYKSTSGSGYHLYIHFDTPVSTNNHNEHSAIARSMLQMMTVETGFDFEANVDCCGMILWVWHLKQEGTDGLSLVHEAKEPFPSQNIPPNWIDFVKEKKKNAIRSAPSDVKDLAVTIKSSKLSEKHKAILKWFPRKAKMVWWWDNELSMLICHTVDLKQCHSDLSLLGVYNTVSASDINDNEQNCFAFPGSNGAFIVRRYSKGVEEHPCWSVDEKGWTQIRYNVLPSFEDSCLFRGGQLDSDNFYNFVGGENVNSVFSDLQMGFKLKMEDYNKPYSMKIKHGKILIRTPESGERIEGFLTKKKHFEKMLTFRQPEKENDATLKTSDESVRHVVSNPYGDPTDAGWYINVQHQTGNKWVAHCKSNVADVLQSFNSEMTGKQLKIFLGEQIVNPWILVSEPFRPEYLGCRQWNKNAPQFKYEPEAGDHPTWDSIFAHLGENINDDVKNDMWCQNNDIILGSEYLLAWVVSMFTRPSMPLPYLFFWSNETDTGKSTFHEALRLLFKTDSGYARADLALRNESGFNGELEHAVLCIIEEIDLGTNKKAAEKIKDYVTSLTLPIRNLFQMTYMVENNTHWCQFANSSSYCPLFKNDTRIVPVQVNPLASQEPKQLLMTRLMEEAPAFMNTLKEFPLPDPHSRLGLPCLVSEEKKELMSYNDTLVDRFVNERLKKSKGHKMKFSKFYRLFSYFIEAEDSKNTRYWSKMRTASIFINTPDIFKGKDASNGQTTIFNVTEDLEAVEKDYIYRLRNKIGIEVYE